MGPKLMNCCGPETDGHQRILSHSDGFEITFALPLSAFLYFRPSSSRTWHCGCEHSSFTVVDIIEVPSDTHTQHHR